MSCPSGSYSAGQVSGASGCTSAVACNSTGRASAYTQIYDKCYTSTGYLGQYYSYTSYSGCC